MSATAVERAPDVIALPEFFDDDHQLRLHQHDDEDGGWAGFEHDPDTNSYYWIDTRQPAGAWPRRLRVGTRAVRLAITEHFDPDADPIAPGAPPATDRGSAHPGERGRSR